MKLGPFRIKKTLGPDMYKLELPKSMKIHPVFHATVLEPAHASIPVATQVPTLETDNNNKEYIVEKVLQSQLVDRQLQYLVKWKGYGMNNNTWEPASQFTSKKVLQDFHQHHPEQPRTVMPRATGWETHRRGQVEQWRSDPWAVGPTSLVLLLFLNVAQFSCNHGRMTFTQCSDLLSETVSLHLHFAFHFCHLFFFGTEL